MTAAETAYLDMDRAHRAWRDTVDARADGRTRDTLHDTYRAAFSAFACACRSEGRERWAVRERVFEQTAIWTAV